MRVIKEKSNHIKSIVDDSLRQQMELQAAVEKLLKNAFDANTEAGGMIYRSNNLNNPEINRITKVLDDLHQQASILNSTIKSKSDSTIKNGQQISELVDQVKGETGEHFCDTMVTKQSAWIFQQTMQEEFGPQPSGFIPFKFEAHSPVEASIN